MATTTFTNGITLTDADWFNDLDRLHYDILNDPADLAALVATLGATNWTITGNLSVQGGTTIGNAAGDAFTIHPSAWTLSNAVTVTGTWANLGTVTTVDINGGTIDGAVIGGSSAAAGSFTTLGATSTLSINSSGASADTVTFTSGSTGTGANAWRFINTGGTYQLGIENSANTYFGIGAYNLGFILPAGRSLVTQVAGTGNITTVSSTGLAVTGALSASGGITTTGTTVAIQPTTVTDGAVVTFFNGGGSYAIGVDSSTGGIFGDGVYSMAIRAPAGEVINTMISGTGTITTVSSTGLAVTGALSCSTNLTVTGGTITTGSTTALSLATSGGTGLRIANTASQVNYFDVVPNVAGAAPYFQAAGSDTNVTFAFSSKGTGNFDFYTNSTTAQQVRISHTASANRYITLTGSNGGNPAISVSAGELAVGTNAWTFGVANSVSPTSPNRTLTVTIGGTTYYIAAKTTND